MRQVYQEDLVCSRCSGGVVGRVQVRTWQEGPLSDNLEHPLGRPRRPVERQDALPYWRQGSCAIPMRQGYQNDPGL